MKRTNIQHTFATYAWHMHTDVIGFSMKCHYMVAVSTKNITVTRVFNVLPCTMKGLAFQDLVHRLWPPGSLHPVTSSTEQGATASFSAFKTLGCSGYHHRLSGTVYGEHVYVLDSQFVATNFDVDVFGSDMSLRWQKTCVQALYNSAYIMSTKSDVLA